MLVDAINDQDYSVLKGRLATLSGATARLEKVASLDAVDRDSLSPAAFAWPEEKMFPIFTPSHALVSSVYLEENENVPDFVKVACQDACNLFGFDVVIGGMEKVAEQAKELSASDFILPAMRKLPAVDKDSFRMSRDIFLKSASDLNFDDIVIGARQLMKKASEFGESIDDSVFSLALSGSIDTMSAKSFLHDRMMITGDSSYTKMAEDISGDMIFSKESLSNLIAGIVSADIGNDLEKSASDVMLTLVTPGVCVPSLTVNGADFSLEKIASIDPYEWKNIFPDSIVGKLFHSGNLDTAFLSSMNENASEEERDTLVSFFKNN